MIKETKVVLGGKERILWFGVMGFYDHIHKHTGKDPIEWINSLTKADGRTTIDSIDEVAVIAFAGINSHADGNDLEPVEYSKVRKWVNGVDNSVLSSICNDAFSAFSEKKSEGEAPAQTIVNGSESVGKS